MPLHVADSDPSGALNDLLSNVMSERPMLRISATIILAFACAAPFVMQFSVVGYGALAHSLKADRPKTSRQNSARVLNSTAAVALQTANAAHRKSSMRERQYNSYGKHRCHRSK
jgi:hypothetical protein